MKFSIITILLIILSSTSAFSQGGGGSDDASETLVMNYLGDLNPEAKNINWMKVEGTDRIRISFVGEGVKQYVLINQEAVEYETGELIGEDDLPDPVNRAFMETKYSEWDVLGIWEASTPYTSGLYRFDVSNSEDETVTLYYNELGESVTVNHNVNPAK